MYDNNRSNSLMTLSSTEAIIGQHFQLGLTGVKAIDSKSCDAKFDTAVILGTRYHEKSNVLISHPKQAQT